MASANPADRLKCANCNKSRKAHQVGTKHCPEGKYDAGRNVYAGYSATAKFSLSHSNSSTTWALHLKKSAASK